MLSGGFERRALSITAGEKRYFVPQVAIKQTVVVTVRPSCIVLQTFLRDIK